MSTKRLVDETRIKKCNTKEDQEGSVCYLMQREHRVNDNWALLYAQQKSQELQQSLVVVVCIDPAWYPTTARHYDFMIQGLQEVESELKKLHIPLYC